MKWLRVKGAFVSNLNIKTSFYMQFLLLIYPFLSFRKEHKAHSPSCNFIASKKSVESLTVEEFLRLQKERQKFIIVSIKVQLNSPCLFLEQDKYHLCWKIILELKSRYRLFT